MKRYRLLMILAGLLAISAIAAPSRTATENFVTNKIAEAVASIPAPDLSGYATKQGLASAAASATNYTDSVAASVRSDIPNVPSWALALTKPSYTWGEITSKPSWIGSSKPSYTLNEICPDSENWLGVQGNAGRHIKILAGTAGGQIVGGVRVTASMQNDNNMTTYTYGGVAVRRNGVNADYLFDAASQNGIVRRSELASVTPGGYSIVSNRAVTAVQPEALGSLAYLDSLAYTDVGAAPSSLSTTVGALSSTVSAIETWAIGDETQLRIENAGQTNATLAVIYTNAVMYSSVVAETNTLAKANAYADANAQALVQAFDAALATDAWGERTSSGAPSPADALVVEKPKLSITGGGNFSYIESSTGGYWVMAVSLGSEWTIESLADAQNPTNPATFALHDAEGNAAYTVTSTASREAYAVDGEQYIHCDSSGANDVITLVYPVVADSAPTIEYAPSTTNEFMTVDNYPAYIASVVSTGQSGMWTNTITTVGHPGRGFFKGKYVKAGHTYTRFNQSIGFDSVVINGVTYTVTVETVGGKNLMVLTEAN